MFLFAEGDKMFKFIDDDVVCMERALELAKNAEGDTSPNPMVGAVIVNQFGEIVGEGWHHKAGEPHAEINAINEAKDKAKGGTIYVTLEPCSHYGRTGPCCDAIIRAGIKKVVYAVADPNPLVAGQGAKRLTDAGIEVECGICEKEAAKLNEKFFLWITKKRPFISVKYAMTLDGKIAVANGDSQWVTGEEALTYSHYLRKTHDAILVGKNTIIEDDSQLTTRLVKGKNPLRIVLDSNLNIPLTARVLSDDAPTVIAISEDFQSPKIDIFEKLPNVEIWRLPVRPEGGLCIKTLIAKLAEKQITSLLIEGGSSVHGAFFDEGLVDRVYAFVAPKIVGGEGVYTPIRGKGKNLMDEAELLKDVEVVNLGKDLLITGRLEERNKCLPDL